jgi:signal transduction histidine kinase
VALPDRLPPAWADRRAAKQILLNLLSNAVKFTERGGSVSVTGEARRGLVAIAVRDTGIGIAETDLERVFKPFERARNAAPMEGTGLGLAIAYTLAERNGGALRLESRVGEGTVAWLELPIHGESHPAADAA